VLSRYREVRDLTDRLAAPLSPEDQVVQSMPDCSPTKWHRAHTTWFFETFVVGEATYDPRFSYFFNSYYEAVGPRWSRAERGLLTRPSVETVAAYRRHVDDAMATFLAGDVPDDVLEIVELGLHHEEQHQELLLMDCKHLLSRNPEDGTYVAGELPTGGRTPKLTWTASEGGIVGVGAGPDGFGFDNERPRHDVLLAPFELADRLVTNEEWQAFVDDGGYRRPELWLSDGWALVQAERWEAPLYWLPEGEFTLRGVQPLVSSAPVCHVSYYEADAFAHWSGARLPLEAEWELVAASRSVAGNFLDDDVLHPTGSESPFGDVWQWTASSYSPYPGFRAAPGAVGEYNGKFMVNQHVLRGGSCVTPRSHVRATYRNFYPPAARWAFSGVRLARSL
jgi:ergothioneine biosynthesis protein EgtB